MSKGSQYAHMAVRLWRSNAIMIYIIISIMKNINQIIYVILQRIRSTVEEKEQKQLLMDLDVVMRSNDCPCIVRFYGALFKEVTMCTGVLSSSAILVSWCQVPRTCQKKIGEGGFKVFCLNIKIFKIIKLFATLLFLNFSPILLHSLYMDIFFIC